jgi:hypothetical protein
MADYVALCLDSRRLLPSIRRIVMTVEESNQSPRAPHAPDRIAIVIGKGTPIAVEVTSLHLTCPTCSMTHTIDVLEESSARDDVNSYNEHVKDCRARSTVS